MNERTPAEVDDYLAALFVGEDQVLERALQASRNAGLPPIAVSAVQGKLLYVLARSCKARRVLEVGTLGGYSAIWMARALPPDGNLISLEIDPHHAEVARASIAAAGLSDVVDVRVGAALDTLQAMSAEGLEPFDLVFIDADKENNPAYLRWALAFSHPGTLIVVDNVVRNGSVIDARSDDAQVIGTRTVLELMAREPRLCATALQTVGHKGYDGLAIALVVA